MSGAGQRRQSLQQHATVQGIPSGHALQEQTPAGYVAVRVQVRVVPGNTAGDFFGDDYDQMKCRSEFSAAVFREGQQNDRFPLIR